jgi:hypothetical protein
MAEVNIWVEGMAGGEMFRCPPPLPEAFKIWGEHLHVGLRI